jgi:hypothetical protein
MHAKNRPLIRWHLILSLGMAIVLAACGAVTPAPAEATPLRLKNGAVEMQGQNRVWTLASGETTFELTGELQSTDPWMVTGNTFAVRDSTRVADGLKVGDLVEVKGVILKDATWLAQSIEPAGEKTDAAITLVGKVDSVEPWMVGGIALDVTADTVLTGKIAANMIARVEILLGEDGSWEVISLAPLSSFTEIPGCATVTARVISVKGNEVQFAGWPALNLGEKINVQNEAGHPAVLAPDQVVLIVICPTQAGQPEITEIIVTDTKAEGTAANGEKVLVCHKPEKKSRHTLSLPAPAVPAHLAHGDQLGACP